MARRKVFSVPLDMVLPALCRDDRARIWQCRSMGLPVTDPHPFVTCDGMPPDAKIVDVRPNPAFQGTLDLLIESELFDDVASPDAAPKLQVEMTRYTSYQTYLAVQEEKVKEASTYTELDRALDRESVREHLARIDRLLTDGKFAEARVEMGLPAEPPAPKRGREFI